MFDSHGGMYSYITVLVVSGSARLSANFCHYELSVGSVAVLSAHISALADVSDDFRCMVLSISHTFMDLYDPAEMVPIRTKYSVMLFRNPVFQLSEANISHLEGRWANLFAALTDVNHYFYRQIVLNAFIAFFLDLSDFLEKNILKGNAKVALTRQELIVRTFIELLTQHFREEHSVGFYADKLHFSAHYLTLIVKKVTGRSPADFVNEMLFGEAKALLCRSELSIQQIADALHFSDQSAFGKFFKRKAGYPPCSYWGRR